MTTIGIMAQKTPLYRNPQATVKERVDDLLGRMTLCEKIGQMNQYRCRPGTDDALGTGVQFPACADLMKRELTIEN